MTKFREPKNPQPLNLSILDLYKQTLWFVIDDCCETKSQQEKAAILRRISNEIFEKPLRSGRGRPKMQSDRRFSALLDYMEKNPELTAHAAASEIARNDLDPLVAHASLVRRLLRQLDVNGDHYAKWRSKTSPRKHPVNVELLESDGKEQWDKLNDAMTDSFISGLRQAFRNFDKRDI